MDQTCRRRTVAITGSVPRKNDNPAVQVTPAEQVESTHEATLLAAKSVAYSDSASGVYVGTELFKKLGIAAEMEGKARMIPADPVAGVVARGDAELGFQQISELLPIPGAELVGPLPPELQKITIFSAAFKDGRAHEQGKALIDFLASPAAAPALLKSGMEPIQPIEMPEVPKEPGLFFGQWPPLYCPL